MVMSIYKCKMSKLTQIYCVSGAATLEMAVF